MLASAQKLGENAKSHAAPAETIGAAPDSRAVRKRTALAPAAQAAEKRLMLQGSGRNPSASDQSFPTST
jgi:hypothetical protein